MIMKLLNKIFGNTKLKITVELHDDGAGDDSEKSKKRGDQFDKDSGRLTGMIAGSIKNGVRPIPEDIYFIDEDPSDPDDGTPRVYTVFMICVYDDRTHVYVNL